MTATDEPARRRRAARWAGIGLVVLAFAVPIGIAASAALDAPSTTVTAETEISADKAVVWATLVDFGAYDTWNPFVVEASRSAGVEGLLTTELRVGEDERTLESSITVYNPERKIRWRSRLVVPGLRDEELEVILEPIDRNRLRARLAYRAEGLLAPLLDDAGLREGLEAMASALKARAEGG
jgi:hypothetical protein